MKMQMSGLLKPLVNVAVIALTVTSLAGCLEEQQTTDPVTTYDVEAIVKDPNLTPEQKGEKLALVAEKLSTPSGFMYADEVLELALSYDSTNIRAQLYKKLSAPVMVLKSAMKRLQPVVRKFSAQMRRAYVDEQKSMALNQSVESFFNNGKADIQTESQAQSLVDQVMAAQNDLRLFLRSHKDISLQLYSVNPVGELPDIWYHCPVQGVDSVGSYHKKYTVKNCKFLRQTEYTIEGGDIEVLQHIAAGMQILSIVATSYDATGGAVFESTMNKQSLNVKQRIDLLQSLKQFGQVRNAATFKMIQALGSDIYSGARWAQKFQNQLCPQGWEHEQRPGKLFDKGICVQDYPGQKPGSTDTAFRVVATALAGQNLAVFTRDGSINVTDMADNTNGAQYSTQANLLAPIMNPIADLKQILPTKFDKCGRTINLGDKTVAGLFPSRDGEEVAKSIGLISEECK